MPFHSPLYALPVAVRATRVPLLVLAALILASLLLAAPRASAQASSPSQIRIVLLPMVVHSSEAPGYLRRGLSDMLASRLARIPDLEVIRIDDSAVGTTNLRKAIKQANKADAGFVLFGSFTRFGTGASLDVQCAGVAAEGEEPLREIFVHSGSVGDVIPDLDDLVGKVARFVIDGYKAQIVAATGSEPNLPSTQVEQLQQRVAALEVALEELTTRLPAPAPAQAEEGAEVAASP